MCFVAGKNLSAHLPRGHRISYDNNRRTVEAKMSEIEQEELLDRQLRDSAPYIDDAGFTARVLKQLPRKLSGPRRESLRAVIIFGITLLASVLAYVLSDVGRFVA